MSTTYIQIAYPGGQFTGAIPNPKTIHPGHSRRDEGRTRSVPKYNLQKGKKIK